MLVGLLVLINPGYYTFESRLDLLVPVVEAAALISLLGGFSGCAWPRGSGGSDGRDS